MAVYDYPRLIVMMLRIVLISWLRPAEPGCYRTGVITKRAKAFGRVGAQIDSVPLERRDFGRIRHNAGEQVAFAKKTTRQQRVGPASDRRVVWVGASVGIRIPSGD
jgi:hypothetical protein